MSVDWRKVADGTLRMLVLFGHWLALGAWRGRWDYALRSTGATFHQATNEYRWSNGAWLRLEVATEGRQERLRGIEITDYEMDDSMRYKDTPEWRALLEMRRRNVE